MSPRIFKGTLKTNCSWKPLEAIVSFFKEKLLPKSRSCTGDVSKFIFLLLCKKFENSKWSPLFGQGKICWDIGQACLRILKLNKTSVCSLFPRQHSIIMIVKQEKKKFGENLCTGLSSGEV